VDERVTIRLDSNGLFISRPGNGFVWLDEDAVEHLSHFLESRRADLRVRLNMGRGFGMTDG